MDARLEHHLMTLSVVTGGGGFIGGQLVKRLLDDGHEVRAVDIKPIKDWHYVDTRAFLMPDSDVGIKGYAQVAVREADEVYNLAADMGGMGFITNNKLDCMLSVMPSTVMLIESAKARVGRFFYSSSACVYPDYRQEDADVVPLKEEHAYPAMPEDGYGWEKLFTERMCKHFREDAGWRRAIARYHNVYGPHGTWTGGREKAPAAICRKVALAALTKNPVVEVWGDGLATRTFMYVDDCVEGTLRIARGDNTEPVNLGSDELVSINDLAFLVAKIAGIDIELKHVPGPQGVRGRSSDNTMIKDVYKWFPSISLEQGLTKTYEWVYGEVRRALGRD
jgi:GDP-D-mannose 3',5'-epimerase